MKWASLTLTVLLGLACVACVFAAIWTSGDFWPVRYGGSAMFLGALAALSSLLVMVAWEEKR